MPSTTKMTHGQYLAILTAYDCKYAPYVNESVPVRWTRRKLMDSVVIRALRSAQNSLNDKNRLREFCLIVLKNLASPPTRTELRTKTDDELLVLVKGALSADKQLSLGTVSAMERVILELCPDTTLESVDALPRQPRAGGRVWMAAMSEAGSQATVSGNGNALYIFRYATCRKTSEIRTAMLRDLEKENVGKFGSDNHKKIMATAHYYHKHVFFQKVIVPGLAVMQGDDSKLAQYEAGVKFCLDFLTAPADQEEMKYAELQAFISADSGTESAALDCSQYFPAGFVVSDDRQSRGSKPWEKCCFIACMLKQGLLRKTAKIACHPILGENSRFFQAHRADASSNVQGGSRHTLMAAPPQQPQPVGHAAGPLAG